MLSRIIILSQAALLLILAAGCPQIPRSPNTYLQLQLPAGRGGTRIEEMAAEGVKFLEPLDGTRYRLDTPARYRAPADRYLVDDDGLRKRLQSRLKKARIALTFEHRLPLPLRMNLLLARDSTDLDTRPDLSLPLDGPVEMPAADYEQRQSAVQLRAFELEQGDIDLFLNPVGVYGALEVVFPPAAGVVVVEGSDFVRLEARLDVIVGTDDGIEAQAMWPVIGPGR